MESLPCKKNLHRLAHFLQDVQVSCTTDLASQESCTFLAPVILQDQNLAHFLHLLSCKMKILQVSCTRYLTRWKSCKFLAPAILQDEILQVSCTRYLTIWKSCKLLASDHKWKFCKFFIQTLVLKFLQDTTSHTCVYTILDSFYFARFNILQHLHFGLIQGFTSILIQY